VNVPLLERDILNPTASWETLAEEIFLRPGAASIVQDVSRKHGKNGHPRILLSAEKLAQLKEKISIDSTYNRWYQDVLEEANAIITEPPAEKPLRHVLQNRILPLGFVYQVSGENRYAERAWLEMEAYTQFQHWNPTTQFLDIAYITKGFAIGFDWIYDYLSRNQREVIVQAVSEKALNLVQVAYANPNQYTPYQNRKITGYDNWNGSINAGMIMVSLAMLDEKNMQDLCGKTIENALRYWENFLKEFTPDGACREGVGYWYWGVQSLVEGMASLESAAGTDYGIGKAPGLATTAYFPLYMTGPKGAFNFGNAKDIFNITAEFFWFAKKYQNFRLAAVRKDFMENSQGPARVYDILWYDQNLAEKGKFLPLPLDMWFTHTESFSFRNGWNRDALFIAMKGGDNMAVHGHLNTGTFVLDAKGERWVTQLGGDRYSNPGYFSKGERNSRGYNYYRVRAEGQNTLLINPDSLSDQLPHAFSRIERYGFTPERAFAIIDMLPAYHHEAITAKRGAMIFDRRSVLLLRDEVICKRPSCIYWSIHTKASIEIAQNGRSAILVQNGKSIRVDLICEEKTAGFSVLDAQPLPTSPQSNLNRSNEGIRKLVVIVDNCIELNLSVVFSLNTQSPILENWPDRGLGSWK